MSFILPRFCLFDSLRQFADSPVKFNFKENKSIFDILITEICITFTF